MYKPPQRIKYTASPGAPPDCQQVEASKLFSPVQVGSLTLPSRTWVPAMVPWRASEDGFVSDDVLDWYERFAAGKPAVIVVEATGIRDVQSGPLLRIGHDRFLPGLKELVAIVSRASGGRTRLFIQLIDFLAIRRRPDPHKFFHRFLDISDDLRAALADLCCNDDQIREYLSTLDEADHQRLLSPRQFDSLYKGYRERVTDVHLEHIQRLPQTLAVDFASAALRASQAGFDGLELHYAHAYTMASFLSRHNQRQDGYGGDRSNRIRLPIEVYRKVSAMVPADFPVGCRFLSDECIDGGSTVEDAVYFAIEFAHAGMDFLSLSRGGKFDDAKRPRVGQVAYPYTGPSGYECMPAYLSDEQGPFGRNIEPVAQIKLALLNAGLTTPVVVAGGLHGFTQCEQILQNGHADIIGAARQSLADPDWFEKIRLGLGHEVRSCEYTNYCEGLDQKHKQVTCHLWDRKQREAPGVKLSKDGKRRLIAPPWKPPSADNGH